MPQQINLFHPVLLAPRRHFSAATMAQALALWTLALAALAAWSLWRTQALGTEAADAQRRQSGERVQLTQAQAARQARSGSPAALQQELDALNARLEERRHLLDEIGGASRAASPTALLAELAQTLPAPVWLSEIRWARGQVELAGNTLQPEALQAWLATRGEPAALRVERQAGAAAQWTFIVRHGRPAAGPARPAGSTP